MSLTKNPLVLQSAMYIYSWFQGKLTETEDAKKFTALEISESDLNIISHIEKHSKDKANYENIEARFNRIEGAWKNENN